MTSSKTYELFIRGQRAIDNTNALRLTNNIELASGIGERLATRKPFIAPPPAGRRLPRVDEVILLEPTKLSFQNPPRIARREDILSFNRSA